MPDAVTFPGIGAPVPEPRRDSLRRRLPHLAVAAANRLVPKIATKVVLHSNVDVEDGVLAVAEELAARGQTATVLLQDPRRAPLLRRLSPVPVRAVPKWSVRGLVHYLTAGHVMTTMNVHGNESPPRGQNSVALWHGEPPSKSTGRFAGNGPLRASYAPVCSTVGRAYRSAAFDIHPLRVPIVGAPRNDRMLRADARAIRQSLLGEDADRTTFLWMPSWRVGDYGGTLRVDVAGADGAARTGGTAVTASASDTTPPDPGETVFSPEALRRINDWLLARGARAVLKVHHRDVTRFAGEHRALTVLLQGDLERRGLTLYPALSAFDALITDMSSVWVDYLLLDKPIIYAFPDVEDYRTGRGLNLEPYEQWVPGPFARTTSELLAAMDDVASGRDPMGDERRRARQRLHRFHDSGSAARLLDGLGLPARRVNAPPAP